MFWGVPCGALEVSVSMFCICVCHSIWKKDYKFFVDEFLVLKCKFQTEFSVRKNSRWLIPALQTFVCLKRTQSSFFCTLLDFNTNNNVFYFQIASQISLLNCLNANTCIFDFIGLKIWKAYGLRGEKYCVVIENTRGYVEQLWGLLWMQNYLSPCFDDEVATDYRKKK